MTEKPFPYLNSRFAVKMYDYDLFIGPAAGDPAIDFTVTDFDGNPVRLSDFRGQWVVLETGSATCSQYTKNIDRIAAIAADFPDVEFLLIYVREAHPGERKGQHKTFADKLDGARLLPGKYGERRRILIDTLDGDMHRAYGAMPNVVYVINPDGIVHYRCDWMFPEGLRDALTHRDAPVADEHASMKQINAARSFWVGLRTMWTGGLLALWDFARAMPAMWYQHKQIDAFYKKHGKFRQHLGD